MNLFNKSTDGDNFTLSVYNTIINQWVFTQELISIQNIAYLDPESI